MMFQHIIIQLSFVLLCKYANGFQRNLIRHVVPGTQKNVWSISVNHQVDVAILGGGPAGTLMAWLLQTKENCSVLLIDPNVDKETSWYPNYGEWRDEWEVLVKKLDQPELRGCTTTEWEITDCFFGGSHDIPDDERTTLNRAYVRVDRIKMQALLRNQYRESGGKIVSSKLSSKRISSNLFDNGLVHDLTTSRLTLDNGDAVQCKVVVDSTGFESRLIAKELPYFARGNNKELTTGYQIAYGFIAEVDKLGPYNVEAMTLFDYRTTYLDDDLEWKKEAIEKPTFMYAMPLTKEPDANGIHRVFWEETSLVGKGSRRLTFQECKRRALKRLSYYNISILGVEEEEYCYIPMGGELPELNQRVIAFGASSNFVHPSTGYQACRMMAASKDVAGTIGQGIRDGKYPDEIAIASYQSMWNKRNRLQRDFQAFGGDFLMAQSVDILRGFFAAFFAAEQAVWGGFLAGWPGLPGNHYHETWNGRFSFAINLFVNMPPPVKVAIIWFAIRYTASYGPNTLLRSVTPGFLFGSGPDPIQWKKPLDSVGEVDAKNEARSMMQCFIPFSHEAHDAVHGKTRQSFLNMNSLPLNEVKNETNDIVEKLSVDIYPSPFNN